MVNRALFQQLLSSLDQQIIGQQTLTERLLIALLANGHLLVEGAPGLAKTKAIKILADHIEGDFQRIQFTPDLLPADITGTEIYRQRDGSFQFQPGPVFHNLILADEINRAPAKVQSALLEAMAEKQVSVGKQSYPLPELFLVMATQNPIEQEGTYPLPEAQLDRFLMHVTVEYPDIEAERQILRLVRSEYSSDRSPLEPDQLLSQQSVSEARREVAELYMAETVEEYIVQLVMATRYPENYSAELADWLEYGCSPRGTIALDICSRAHAWLKGQDYVTPEDVQLVVKEALRHRVICSFEAEAEGIDNNRIIDKVVHLVPSP